ncbi:hypothetical protein CANCADRAFT_14350, partial [Tortispora caseinolytica NRRL Y-17796]
LHLAAQQGDFDQIKSLVTTGGVSADLVAPDNTRALHWAAINNRIDICQFLIDSGCEIDPPGGDLDGTPLHWAAQAGHVYTVYFLIENGADPLRKEKQGYNALHLAVHSSNVLTVTYLLHQGVPVNSVDSAGRTSLHWAAYQGDALSLDVLLRWGANVTMTDDTGFTALHWGVVRGNVACMRRLIEDGSIVTVRTSTGKNCADIAQDMNNVHAYELALYQAGYTPSGSPKATSLPPNVSRLLILFCPYLYLPLIILSITSLPIFLGIPVLICLSFAFFFLTTKVLIPLHYYNFDPLELPLLCGIFSGTLFWVGVAFFTNIIPEMFSSHTLLCLSFFLVYTGVLVTFLQSMLADPGFIDRPSSVKDQYETIRNLLDKHIYDSRHFCLTCFMRKPLRSKHCKFCKRCIARMDHHCPWIDNCVGVRNHRSFTVFVVLLWLGVILFVSLVFQYVPMLLEDQPLENTFGLTVWSCLQEVWLTALLVVQIHHICRNLTSNEASRIDTVLKPGKTYPRTGRFAKLVRLLGLDQFAATARETAAHTFKHQNTEIMYDQGVKTNCMDFWRSHSHNKFSLVQDTNEGYLGGQVLDYSTLYELP